MREILVLTVGWRVPFAIWRRIADGRRIVSFLGSPLSVINPIGWWVTFGKESAVKAWILVRSTD